MKNAEENARRAQQAAAAAERISQKLADHVLSCAACIRGLTCMVAAGFRAARTRKRIDSQATLEFRAPRKRARK